MGEVLELRAVTSLVTKEKPTCDRIYFCVAYISESSALIQEEVKEEERLAFVVSLKRKTKSKEEPFHKFRERPWV